MIRFQTRGSAQECGKQSAAPARELALRWYEDAQRMLKKSVNAALLEERAQKALVWMDEAAQFLPALVEELHALAAELGIPWKDYAQASFTARLLRLLTCSTFGGWDADGRAMVAKTDDLQPAECGMNVMQECFPEKGIAHVKFHFAGTLFASSGWNAKGLFVGLTGIPGPNLNTPAVSTLWLIPRILECCTTVSDAWEMLGTLPVSHYGCSLLLADAENRISLIEKNALGLCRLPQIATECYAHTNHILDPRLSQASPSPSPEIAQNSYDRYAFLSGKLAGQKFSAALVRELLKKGNEEPSIFQSGSAPLHTDYAVFAIPCRHEYHLWTNDGREARVSQ